MLQVTVSQLNRYIKAVLEEDKKLSDLYIKGEISNFKHHYSSGHYYFSLKDNGGSIRAVMFRSDAQSLRFEPENGMAVLAQARIGVYERDGSYQLYVTDLQPDGIGALSAAFEQRKKKLAELGMFDAQYKKQIPSIPQRVGIVTSETGAALQDILHVLARRWPLCTAVIIPTLVQGSGAADAVAAALKTADTKGHCDVIILGRGGGSMEDLWCFNEEAVAYAVFRCKTPVISAVGHETDYTICDYVADLRAPTPSAAAELAVPSIADFRYGMDNVKARMYTAVLNKLDILQEETDYLGDKLAKSNPQARLKKEQERLDFFAESLYNKKRIIMQKKQDQLLGMGKLLNSLNPLNILERGYCVAYVDDKTILSVKSLRPGDKAHIQFRDGKVVATVESIGGEEVK